MPTQQKLNQPDTITEITIYAGYQERIISTFIDLLLMMPVWYVADAILRHTFTPANHLPENLTRAMPEMIPGFVGVFYCLFYMPIMDATGGTIGKRVMRIESVDATTLHKAHFMNHFGRGGILLVFCALLFIPVALSAIALFFTDKKQTIHDIISNILVVRKKRI